MNDFLLTVDELVRITGAKRYSKQRQWFKAQFGIDVVRNGRGEIILTRTAFDALLMKRCSIEPARGRPEVELYYD